MRALDFFRSILPAESAPHAVDLCRLDALGDDLGTRAAHHVRTGRDEGILKTLSLSSGAADLLSGSDDDAPILARRHVFLDADPYDPALVARYSEVLTACFERTGRAHPLAGPRSARPALRTLFGEAFLGTVDPGYAYPRRPREAPVEGLTPEAALAVGEALGAPPAEVISVFLWEDSNWSTVSGAFWRGLVDLPGFLACHGAAVASADSLLNTESRAALARRIVEAELSDQPPYLALLADHAIATSRGLREPALAALRSLPLETLELFASERLADTATRDGTLTLLTALGTEGAASVLRSRDEARRPARPMPLPDKGTSLVSADNETGYTALDGTRIEIPPPAPLPPGADVSLTFDTRLQIEEALCVAGDRAHRLRAAGVPCAAIPDPRAGADAITRTFETGEIAENKPHEHLRTANPALWANLLAQLPLSRQIALSPRAPSVGAWITGHAPPAVHSWLISPAGDLRVFAQMLGHRLAPGALMEALRALPAESLPGSVVWPFIAANLGQLDAPMGLHEGATAEPEAIRLLARLPGTPLRFLGPLLDSATRPGLARDEARALLDDLPDLDDRLTALLQDPHPETRAGAAEWLGLRKARTALEARLPNEHHPIPRAAILTALRALGTDLSEHLGPEALTAEAMEAQNRIAPCNGAIPDLLWRDGTPVPEEVPLWWITLAARSKSVEDPMARLRLGELDPASATALSSRILAKWSETEDAPTGLLSLAAQADSNALAASLSRHRDRRKKATTLLDLPALPSSEGFPLLIEVARQSTDPEVQQKAMALLGRLAPRQGLSPETLADRIVPLAGLDEYGVLHLSGDADAEPCTAHFVEDSALRIVSPHGPTAILPPEEDEATKTRLAASRKLLRQITAAETARLHEALCLERVWRPGDWTHDLAAHPVLRPLLIRIVWLGLGGDEPLAFRLGAEGCIDIAGHPIDPERFSGIMIAQASHLLPGEPEAWQAVLDALPAGPLLPQMERPFLEPTHPGKTLLTDSDTRVLDAFALRNAAARLGYARGQMNAEGRFDTYERPFPSANLRAVITFIVPVRPEEDRPVALLSLTFVSPQRVPLRLGEVPPLLLSDCWCDFREMAARGVPV